MCRPIPLPKHPTTGILILGLLLFFPLAFTHLSHAQTTAPSSPTDPAPADLNLVGHLGGLVGQVKAVGNYLYLAQGPEFAVLDITQPLQIHRVGYFVLDAEITSFDVVGNYAYVAWKNRKPFGEATGGLQILDVSIPTAISDIGNAPLPDEAVNVIVNGDYAYIAWADLSDGYYGTGAIVVLDVSDPTTPVEITSYPVFTAPTAFAVADGFGYLLTLEGELITYDFHDPTQIRQTDQQYQSGHNLQASGDYIFIPAGGLKTLSLADPAHPELVGDGDLDIWTEAIDIQDNYAYVTDTGPYDENRGIYVLDLTDPLEPVQVGFVPLSASKIENIAVQGNYVYGSVVYRGVSVVDVSTPSVPQIVAQYKTPGNVAKVVITEEFAYPLMADSYYYGSGGLWISEIANLENPTSLSFYTLEKTHSFASQDSIAYTLTTQSVNLGEYYINVLRILDFSDPTHPILLSRIDLPGDVGAEKVAIYNQYVYVAHPSRLTVIDARDPATPVVVQMIPQNPNSKQMIIADKYAYISDFGLRILDLSDPAFPVEVGSLTLSPGFGYLAVWNTYVYLAAYNTLYIVDVSTPTSPMIVGKMAISDNITSGVAANGGYVFLSNFYEGLTVINALDPTQPFVAQHLPYPYRIHDVVVRGGQIFLSTDDNGLYIFDYAPLIQTFFLPMVIHQP